MTELVELACPVLRAAARLHPNQARRPIGKVLQKLSSLELHALHLPCIRLHPMHLEHALCDVYSNHVTLHLGTLRLPGRSNVSSTWALRCRRRRRVLSIYPLAYGPSFRSEASIPFL